jgi:multiple sugar transport system permease protein
VLLSFCVGVPAAYAFARFPFTGRTFLFFALLVMRMLPPIAVLVPMYVLFSKLGLATTRFSVVLADTTFALPLLARWLAARGVEGARYPCLECRGIAGTSPGENRPARHRVAEARVLPLGGRNRIADASPTKVRFAFDSPLEGDGFELSVPRQKDNVFEAPQLDSAIPGEAIAHQMATA